MSRPLPSASDAPATEVDLAARVRLAHARLGHLLEAEGIRALHLKGYAVDDGVYAPGRVSSDVDILVPPEDAERTCLLLASHGWDPVADFSEGSVFRHAATLWHSHLGYVDVHRLFPGLGSDPSGAFETLWASRGTRVIAGRPVPVPSLVHQRLIVVVHGARDPGRGRADIAHLRGTLSAEEWEQVRAAAGELDAGAAWHVATDEETGAEDEGELRLFRALAAHESGMDLLVSRWTAAPDLRTRLRLVAQVLPVNRPHLQMRLGRTPTRADLVREQAHRAVDLLRWLRGKAVSRVR